MVKKLYFLMILGLLVISIAACNETDISKIVKNLPDVQQFMQEHPSADMKIIYLGDSVVATKINDIRLQCTEDVPQVAMYYVEFKEGTAVDMKLWLDANTQQLLCGVKKSQKIAGNETIEVTEVIQINKTEELQNVTSEINETDKENIVVDTNNEEHKINETANPDLVILKLKEPITLDIDGLSKKIEFIDVSNDGLGATIRVQDENATIFYGRTTNIGELFFYIRDISFKENTWETALFISKESSDTNFSKMCRPCPIDYSIDCEPALGRQKLKACGNACAQWWLANCERVYFGK